MAIIFGKTSIPKNAYSIYQIATFEKIPHESITKLAESTLSKMISASPKKDGAGVKKAFNLIGRYNYATNDFLFHKKLEPFAKGIKMETETSLSGAKLTKCDFITFYIDKKDYELKKKRGIPYTEKPSNSEVRVRQNEIKENTQVRLPLNNKIKHFKDTITKLGYTFSDGVQLAVSFFMEKHTDIFGNVEREEVDESTITENKTSLISAYIDPEIKNAVWKVLQRYNAVNFPPIRFSDFVETALAEKLKNTDVRYTNPQLYKEYLQALRDNAELEKEKGVYDESV